MVRVRESALSGNANVIDNNFYYDPNGAVFLDDNLDWQEWTLAQWKAQTFRDLHSFDTDPKLDVTYHLLAISPCINAGVDISVVTRDIDGHLRTDGANDVGADEFGSVTVVQGPSQRADFGFNILGNSGADQLLFEVISEKKIETVAQILGLDGRILRSKTLLIAAGKSSHTFEGLELPAAVYVLRVGGISKKVVIGL